MLLWGLCSVATVWFYHLACLPLPQVSPHEFMQAVILASKKRFTLESVCDPVDFFSWLLNALHADLTGGKIKKQSIITQCFQVRLSSFM
jgi:ubiquitin C-terminal hydrolase